MGNKNFKGFNSTVGWLDIETGGFDKNKCPILSLAIIITDNMKEIDRCEFRFLPLGDEFIHDQALETNGFTRDEIENFPEYRHEIKRLILFLEKHAKNKKLYVGGHNTIKFDIPFIKIWSEKRGGELDIDKYFYTSGKSQVDTKVIAEKHRAKLWPEIKPKNIKLSTLCEFYNIDIAKAHDALDDTKRTISLYYNICRDYHRATSGKSQYVRK